MGCSLENPTSSNLGDPCPLSRIMPNPTVGGFCGRRLPGSQRALLLVAPVATASAAAAAAAFAFTVGTQTPRVIPSKIQSFCGIFVSTPVGGPQFWSFQVSVKCGETVYSDFERSNIFKTDDKKTANVQEFPWKVDIFYRGDYLCGGSILNEWWILSASHCFIKKDKSSLEVVYDDGKSHPYNLTMKKVDRLITHSFFDTLLFHNDIALLLLKVPFNFSVMGIPICLTEITETWNWRRCRFTISYEGVRARLEKVNMELVEWRTCSQILPMVTMDMLCARSPKDWKNACQGDSGGALVCQKKNKSPWYQLGIVSWNVNCDQKSMIGVYTRVSSYLLWMFEQTTTAGNTFMPDPDSGYNLLLSPSPILLLFFVMLLLTL